MSQFIKDGLNAVLRQQRKEVMAAPPLDAQPLIGVQMTPQQAEIILEALEEKRARESGDERRMAVLFTIEQILSSGVGHSKER